jgi:endonuclease YncB( thermonuclease family)
VLGSLCHAARRWPGVAVALTLSVALTLGVAGLSATATDGSVLLGRVSHVTDGDTLTLTADGARQRIRLFQIDAPERQQPGGAEARGALHDKVADNYVRVQVITEDDYGRLVGTVFLGDRDINRELVQEGHAWVYRRYLEDPSLLDQEAAARRGRRGLWSQEDPTPPWQWRQQANSTARDTTPAGDCRIKGNVNGRGDRIYHQPDDRSYDQTRINTSNGERWFCSAREAEQAGWRRAR